MSAEVANEQRMAASTDTEVFCAAALLSLRTKRHIHRFILDTRQKSFADSDLAAIAVARTKDTAMTHAPATLRSSRDLQRLYCSREETSQVVVDARQCERRSFLLFAMDHGA